MTRSIALAVAALAIVGCAADTVPIGSGRSDTDVAAARDAAIADATPADAIARDAEPPRDAAAPDAAAPDAAAFPDAAVFPDGGRPVGAPCERADECASRDSPYATLVPRPCLVESTDNGWPDGYCIDYCTLPEDPLAGPALLRSDCPAGAVCVPRFDELANVPESERRDIGVCMAECTADTDCRTDPGGFGYFCRRHFVPSSSSMPPFTNGYCAAPHCRSRGCPQTWVCGC